MFNNKFLKNDPLLEAVKAARADGDARRLAESMANDLFGVFSRKAVVREHLSDYDFALEEAYKCMKEEDKMADKDYDRDGKIETSKKEVWGSRLRAAKASGKYKGPVDEKKMWEGSAVSGEDPGMEVAKQAGARQQAQTPSSTPARTGNAAGATISKAKDALNELTKPTAKTAMDAYHRAYDSDVRSGGEGKRTARLGRWKEKHLPGKSARNQKDTGKAELDDYDRKTVKKSGVLTKASQKDTKAEIKSRLGKHTKPKHLPEEQIDEISKELAGRYIKNADYKRSDSSFQSGKVYGKELATKRRTKQDVEDARKHNRDAFKREKGINTAVNKLTGKAKVAANEEVMKESIVAKLFAKYMKEGSSFKSAQVIEANAFDLGKTVPDASMKMGAAPKPASTPFNMGNIKPDAGLRIAANSKLPPSLMSRVMRSPVMRGNPISAGASMGAAASSGLGYLATQTKAGQEAGQWIRKNVPGAETAANAMRQAGEFLGVRDKSSPAASKPAAAPAAGTPKPAAAPASAPKPATAVTTAPAPKPAAAPAPTPAAASAKSSYFKGGSQGDYTIKRGDTLSGIAKRTGQSVSDLASMNKISDVNKISSGAKLMTKVPTPPSRPADATPSSTPASTAASTSVDRSSSNPPTTSGNPTPVGSAAITQDAQKKQKTTQDAGTSSAAAPMAECVQIGANKYRIV